MIVAYVLTKLSADDRNKRLSYLQAQQSMMAVQQTMIHDLVNSNMQEMKRLYSLAMARIATLTDKTSDKLEAIDAMQAYETHKKKQDFLNARAATTAVAAEI